MTHEPVRVGIAGLGRSGWDIHASILADLGEHYQIVAVTDADTERCREAAARFGSRMYANMTDFLADDAVEVVVVALPSHVHAEVTTAALEAGKHVVCEKPMATSLEEADRMIAAAENAGRVLTIFQNRRYSPEFVKVRELLATGILGRIVLIRLTASRFSRRWDWQTLKEYGGGSLNNTAAHLVDLSLLLFGASEPEIFCHMERTLTLGDAEDHIKIVLKGEKAPMIDIEISDSCAYPQELWNITGTQGGLTGSDNNLRWKSFDPATLPPRSPDTRPTPDRSYNYEDPDWNEGNWDVRDDSGPGQAGFYLDLYKTLRNGEPLVITPQSVRRVIWLLEECRKQSPV